MIMDLPEVRQDRCAGAGQASLEPTRIPDAYLDHYPKACAVDRERAANYVAHTVIGDPLADAMIVDLEALGAERSTKLIGHCMAGKGGEALRSAPASVRDFFEHCAEPPAWVDLLEFLPGCRMFHRNVPLVLAGMVGGVLVEGFSTNIAKSFFITGRLRDQGVRRLKQNNRHMLEIFMPGGMDVYNDGWAHSVRVRLVHAKVRYLLSQSDDWDEGELGTPISAAHVGFAIVAFSARSLDYLKKLGASFSKEESRSFMAVWRYSGYLMGIPETILYRDLEDALDIYRIGRMCEPPPSMESIALASSLLNSAPLVAGVTETDKRQMLAGDIGRVSRALVGKTLADELMIPKSATFGILWKIRMLSRIKRLAEKLNPRYSRPVEDITRILDISMYDEGGISYKLPDNPYAELSSKW